MTNIEDNFLATLIAFPHKIKWALSVVRIEMFSLEGQKLWKIIQDTYERFGTIHVSLLMEAMVKSLPKEYVDKILRADDMSGALLRPYFQQIEQSFLNNQTQTILKIELNNLKKGNNIDVYGLADKLKGLTTTKIASSFSEVLENETQKIEDAIGKEIELPFGMLDIDMLVGGFLRENLYVIGASTSTGKTAIALSCAISLLKQHKRILVDSVEMSWNQLTRRLLTMISGLSVFLPKALNLKKEEWRHIKGKAKGIKDWNLHVINTTDISKLHSEISKFNPDVVFVDYLQLFPTKPYAENRVRAMGEIARRLKLIAEDENINVCVLSQLHRGASDANREPSLEDLRDSGEIEQNADIVMLLYRKWLYDKTANPYEISAAIAKNRNGPIGRVNLTFSPEEMRIYGRSDGKDS